MKIYLLSFLFLATICIAQEKKLTLNQKSIAQFGSSEINISFDRQSKLVEIQDNEFKTSKFNSAFTGRVGKTSLNSNERIVSSIGSNSYKIKYTDNGTKQFIKSNNGSDVAQLEMDLEGEIQIIDKDGYAIYCDFLDGAATAYSFYSPELNLLNSYKPYEGDFNRAIFDYSDKIVATFSQEGDYSEFYKISILDHQGNLIRSKEFQKGENSASDIKVVNGKILLLMNSTNSASSIVRVFDDKLNIAWEKKLSKRVVNYQLVKSERNNTVIVSTQDVIECISVLSGNKQWEVPTNQLTLLNGDSRQIELEYVADDEYLAVSIGGFQNSTRMTNDNALFLLSKNDGVNLYNEKLGATKTSIKILGGSNGFILMKDGSLKSYNIK